MSTRLVKTAIICAAAALLCALPYSPQPSSKTGITLACDTAQARVGRPLTPGSVAGVARRSGRRAVRRSYYGAGVVAPACAWVNGVRVCR